jgi:hypothetical protein
VNLHQYYRNSGDSKESIKKILPDWSMPEYQRSSLEKKALYPKPKCTETSESGHATGNITLLVADPKRIIVCAESVHDKRP